ncbi:matrixin family metalloprotease [Cohnella yongneupensis]|uniref:Matrixin family metalloprotease n=1 Tax=Cohnella yongneupensis TaxID=425006 RepID=A0ABW0QYA5_9BACL
MKLWNKNMLFIVLAVLTIAIPMNASAYVPYYYKMIGGISPGLYDNNATPYNYYGQMFYMDYVAESAFTAWGVATTKANLINADSYGATGTIKVRSYSDNYGNIDLYGWAEMYNSNNVRVNGYRGASGPSSNYNTGSIYLNVYDMAESSLNFSQMKAVAIHELGHIWGLDHQRNGTASVMNDITYISNGWLTPQSDDINGVNNIN